jgi:iron complex transport system substrate-binding protein
MRPTHASHVGALLAALTFAIPAVATHRHAPAGPPTPRIVSTFLCTDEYAYRLLPRDQIAGLSYLAGDTHPVVSTISNSIHGIPLVHASAEEILALKPTLVLTYRNTNVRLKQALEKAHVPILEVPWAQSLADVRRITRNLGDRLQARQRAAALVAEMDARLVSARLLAAHPPVRTLIYEPNGYATQGNVSDEILAAAGLRNMADSMHTTRSGTLPVESVLAAHPELLILNSENETAPSRANLVQHHPAFSALNGRAYIVRMPLTSLLCPGPWSADVAGTLARLGQTAQTFAHRRTQE